MAKKKTNESQTSIQLIYHGVNGLPYINGIPARDLEPNEVIKLAGQFNMGLNQFVELLCSGSPGRTNVDGKPLYSVMIIDSDDHNISIGMHTLYQNTTGTWSTPIGTKHKTHNDSLAPAIEEEIDNG